MDCPETAVTSFNRVTVAALCADSATSMACARVVYAVVVSPMVTEASASVNFTLKVIAASVAISVIVPLVNAVFSSSVLL